MEIYLGYGGAIGSSFSFIGKSGLNDGGNEKARKRLQAG